MTRLPDRAGGLVSAPRAVRAATARAHAKVVLSGEHAVVYGGPAVAVPVPALTITAAVVPQAGPARVESALYTGSLEAIPPAFAAPATAVAASLERFGAEAEGFLLRLDGRIPPARGLGSSAAAAAAISQALALAHGEELTPGEHFALIQAAERVAHGNPSGLDARAVTAAGPIWFQAGTARELDVRFDGVFLVADTGEAGETRDAVDAVARLMRRDEARTRGILAGIDAATRQAADLLAGNDAAGLGRVMSTVHTLLTSLTVSSPALDRLVRTAEGAGALGAKLTGAGRGGCVLALAADAASAARVAAALRDAGAATWTLGTL